MQPPYPPRRSPDLTRTRAHSTAWAHRMGLVAGPDPWFAIWDEQDLADFDLPLFAALVHPEGRGDTLNLVADWYTWSWYLDDLLLERHKRTRDPLGARAFLDRLARIPGGATPSNPVEHALRDLWQRTAASPAWRARLAECLPNIADDALWEIDNLALGRIPDPADYLGMRRLAGGAHWAAQLAELVLELELPAAIRDSSAMRRLGEAFADVVDLHNDLLSYRRETEYEQEVSNAVVVHAAFLGEGVESATIRTGHLLTARLELFEHLCHTEIPALLTRHDPTTAAITRRYLGGLRDWLAGDFQWHLETRRYRPESWQRKTRSALGGPRGLGTSAARVGR